MAKHSLILRLWLLIATAFALLALVVLLLADYRLREIVDNSQRAIYVERLDRLLGLLNSQYQPLAATAGMATEAATLQTAVLSELRQLYPVADPATAPLILAADGQRLFPPGASSNSPASVEEVLKRRLPLRQGSFQYTTPEGGEYWYVYTTFAPWQWTIAYIVPLATKYAEVRQFRLELALILLGITLVILVPLALVVAATIQPVWRLTHAASAIAAGQLDQRIETSRVDEFGTLAHSVARMRDALRQRINDLAEKNEQLLLEINRREQIEAELRRLRNLLANIINSMPSVLIGVDNLGRVMQWNQEAERVTGLSAVDVQGCLLVEVFPLLGGSLAKVQQAIRERRTWVDSRVPWGEDGEGRYADVTVYPLIGNHVEGAVIRVDEVTERVRLEETMIQSEKMLSVGGLAAGMAHEINNPLAGILQNAQLIRNRLQADTRRNQEVAVACGISHAGLTAYLEQRGILGMLEAIHESGWRAARIVENMLSFSRKGEARRTPQDLRALLDRTVELVANDYDLQRRYDFRRIEISRDYDPTLPAVRCEASKIQQVFLNILKNGAEAMAVAGNADRPPRFILRLQQEPGWARIEIEDNGPGMEELVRRRVFEPFFTTKGVGQGTGLGLSVSYFIITENHHGTLDVEAAPPHGSRFIIRLPLGDRYKAGPDAEATP